MVAASSCNQTANCFSAIDSPKATNGIQGALSVSVSVSGIGTGTDGTIAVTNFGAGGINELQALTNVSTLTLTTGNGPITLSANLGTAGSSIPTVRLMSTGSGKITGGSKAVITADNLFATSITGAITLPNVAGGNVTAQTGPKAAVSITNLTGNLINIANASGSTVTVKSLGQLDTTGLISAGTVTLSTSEQDRRYHRTCWNNHRHHRQICSHVSGHYKHRPKRNDHWQHRSGINC